MVYSGLYPIDGSDYPNLREALDKLKLNDAALTYEPETSAALGFGFRCGFLGLLHLEIIRERLEREFDLDLISTAPERGLPGDHGRRLERDHGHQPERVPERQDRRASTSRSSAPRCSRPTTTSARSWSCARAAAAPCSAWTTCPTDRVELRYTLPLARDHLRLLRPAEVPDPGYASLDYEPTGEQASDLVKVDILLHGEPVDAFSAIVHKDKAYNYGVSIAAQAAEADPAAAVRGADPGGRSAAGSSPARRSGRSARTCSPSATAVTSRRKRKLLEKQKEGKKRMKMVGRVEVPQEAFIAALSTTDGSGDKSGSRK